MSLHVRFIPSLVRWNQGRRRIQTNSVPDLLLISVISLFIEKWVFNVRKEHNDWFIGQEDQKKKNLSIHSFQVCFSFSHFTHFNVRLEQRWLRKEGVGTSVRKPCSRRMFRAAVPLGLLLTDFYRGLTHTSCNESRFMYDCSHLRRERLLHPFEVAPVIVWLTTSCMIDRIWSLCLRRSSIDHSGALAAAHIVFCHSLILLD